MNTLTVSVILLMAAQADTDLFHATLCDATQPSIELHYQGTITEFRGPLCYHFAGYTEACLDLPVGWLTPATVINLIAPGQVPLEILQNYTLLIRLPSMGNQSYTLPLAQARCTQQP